MSQLEPKSTDPKLPAKLQRTPLFRPSWPDAEPVTPDLHASWPRELCLAAGADDEAPVSLDHADLAGEGEHVLGVLALVP